MTSHSHSHPPTPTEHLKTGTPSQTFQWLRIGLAVSVSAAFCLTLAVVVIRLYGVIQADAQKEYSDRQSLILDKAVSYRQIGNFAACLREATQIQSDAPAFSSAQRVSQDCQQRLVTERVQQARHLAAQGEYKRAVALVNDTPDVRNHGDGQAMIRQLSEQMYAIAWQYYGQPSDSFNQAQAVLQSIPPNSPIYGNAQQTMQQMHLEWLGNQRSMQAAQASLEDGDLVAARTYAALVSQHPFWQQQLQPLLLTLSDREDEQRYARIAQEAQFALRRNEPGNAIRIAKQLPDTFPWEERKANITAQAEAELRQLQLCQSLLSWLIDCYPSPRG